MNAFLFSIPIRESVEFRHLFYRQSRNRMMGISVQVDFLTFPVTPKDIISNRQNYNSCGSLLIRKTAVLGTGHTEF